MANSKNTSRFVGFVKGIFNKPAPVLAAPPAPAEPLVETLAKRKCPCCGYHEHFVSFGLPPRIDARCPNCQSLERDRLFKLAFDRGELFDTTDLSLEILHFAPERPTNKLLKDTYENYKTADLNRKDIDLKLNIEKIDLPDESQDIVIASHILEHVDDQKAAQEIWRILKKNGRLFAMVPIIEGWDETYENDKIQDNEGRTLHFGQYDHVRYYGKDFRSRILAGGFSSLREITAFGKDVIDYGLVRGEKIFIFAK